MIWKQGSWNLKQGPLASSIRRRGPDYPTEHIESIPGFRAHVIVIPLPPVALLGFSKTMVSIPKCPGPCLGYPMVGILAGLHFPSDTEALSYWFRIQSKK